jgi:hypothetical protein
MTIGVLKEELQIRGISVPVDTMQSKLSLVKELVEDDRIDKLKNRIRNRRGNELTQQDTEYPSNDSPRSIQATDWDSLGNVSSLGQVKKKPKGRKNSKRSGQATNRDSSGDISSSEKIKEKPRGRKTRECAVVLELTEFFDDSSEDEDVDEAPNPSTPADTDDHPDEFIRDCDWIDEEMGVRKKKKVTVTTMRKSNLIAGLE